MDEVNLLLRQVISNPDDDTVRLAYADALEERGQRDDVLWATNIRYMIKWNRGDYSIGVEYDPEWEVEIQKVIKALKKKPLFVCGGKRFLPFNGYDLRTDEWRRGFIYKVNVDTFEDWVSLSQYLYWNPSSQDECPPTAHPVETVEILVGKPDRPPGGFTLPEYPGINFRRAR